MFKIISGNKTFEIEKAEQLDLVDLGNHSYSLIQNNEVYNIQLVSVNLQEKKITLTINGNENEFTIEDQYDLLLKKMGINTAASKKISKLSAPMPGLVLKIMVQEGQSVAKDEALLVLEAMKMENIIKSPADLQIKSIAVKEKDAVEKGQLLVEFV